MRGNLYRQFAVSTTISLLCLSFLIVTSAAQTTKKSSSSSSSSSSYTPPSRPEPPPHVEPPPRPNPSYTPQPRTEPNNTPQPRPSEPTNYTPQPNNNTGYHPTPNPNQPSTNTSYRPPVTNTQPHSYTPGGNNGTTGNTYTPGTTHTYSPGANTPTGTNTYTPGGTGTHTVNGTTVYTPSAPSSTGVATANGTVYTPSAHTTTSPSTPAHQVYSVPVSNSSSSAKGSSLDTKSSATTIQQLNTSRSALTGINKHPLPTGTVTTHTNGTLTIAAAGGKQFNVRPNGTISTITSGHEQVAFTPSGNIRSIHTPTVDVYHGPHGVHTIVQHRADKSTLVSTSRHSGYLERPFTHGGQTLVARTYLSHGVTSTRVFHGYSLHGARLDYYIPANRYAPDYYGWAYYPWDAPAAYAWGWDGQGWFTDFANYFAASQGYASPADWLTDYLLGNTLQDADQMQADSDDDSGQADDSQYSSDDPDAVYAQTDAPITPDLKQAIAQEVQQQIAYENAATANPSQTAMLADLPQALVPDHLFVVNTPLYVVTVDNQTCSLGAGNVIRLVTPPSDSNPTATLTVAASRRLDCPAGAQVTLSLSQLQEMENNYRTQIDGGLDTLHQQQGQRGLPQAPYAAIQPPPIPSDEYPTDHPDVAALLKSERTVGTQTEAQANQLVSTQVATTTKH